MVNKLNMLILLSFLLALPVNARAADAWYDLPVGELRFARSGALAELSGSLGWRTFSTNYPMVSVVGGEGFVTGEFSYWDWPATLLANGRVAMRVPAGKELSGTLILPTGGKPSTVRLAFTVPASKASKDAANAFAQARREHYRRLGEQGHPGGAWFRLQANQGVAPGGQLPAGERADRIFAAGDELSRTYDLFTGTMALSENLQLDRVLSPVVGKEATVTLDSLEGISVAEIDWTARIAGKSPRKDPLAAFIPADQHALFFPTFSDLIRLSDEADVLGTPVLALLESRSEESGVKRRYQDQLCLSMSGLSRLLGPSVVNSVAMTGSDPYLRMGSDVAVLFEARNPALLVQHLKGKQESARAGAPEAQEMNGEADGLAWSGLCNRTRSVCSFLAVRGDVVVVTNSVAQMARIAATMAGKEGNLGALPEYTFFRSRYPLGEGDETAFLLLSDAAIRRWCSPRWRIADSRRLRVAAVLSHLHALNAGGLQGGDSGGKLDLGRQLPDIGPVERAEGTILAGQWGTLGFMTPISELQFDKVSAEEAEAYNWFRSRYQSSWRNYFDPIAIRFFLSDDRLGVDLSVMPLIAGSEYGEMIELTTGGKGLAPEDGDPHPETLLRYGMALNPESRLVKQLSGFAVTLAPGLKTNVISWLGSYVELYADQDPFWRQLVAAEKKERFIEQNFHRLPVAARVAVSSPLQVTAFLTAVRTFIEQAAPGMTIWETLNHKGLAYVKVSPAQQWDDDLPRELAFYYAVADKALTLTLNESVLKRSLERSAKRQASAEKRAQVNRKGQPWLGEHAAFQADGEVLELVELGVREELVPELQLRSWGNLHILNEWKRLFPGTDPVAVHQRLFGTRLTCPGGGEYRWNEEWQTMESTAYGHPGEPIDGPGLLRPPLSEITAGNFGLTFEDDGLRARAELWRGRRPGESIFSVLLRNWCLGHPNLACGTGSAALLLLSATFTRLSNRLPW